MRPLAVFDLDGVLADSRHRAWHLEQDPPAWDAFFRAVGRDPLLADGATLVREAARDCDVVYLSGRPERCRRDTLAWLSEHGMPEGELVLRPEGDRRPAATAKATWLASLARERVVAVAVDDDEQVCHAHAARGWTVLHATWGVHPVGPEGD